MQSFWFFVPTKELGVRGLVPENNVNIKNTYLNSFAISLYLFSSLNADKLIFSPPPTPIGTKSFLTIDIISSLLNPALKSFLPL